jgi:hypothetical protein
MLDQEAHARLALVVGFRLALAADFLPGREAASQPALVGVYPRDRVVVSRPALAAGYQMALILGGPYLLRTTELRGHWRESSGVWAKLLSLVTRAAARLVWTRAFLARVNGVDAAWTATETPRGEFLSHDKVVARTFCIPTETVEMALSRHILKFLLCRLHYLPAFGAWT